MSEVMDFGPPVKMSPDAVKDVHEYEAFGEPLTAEKAHYNHGQKLVIVKAGIGQTSQMRPDLNPLMDRGVDRIGKIWLVSPPLLHVEFYYWGPDHGNTSSFIQREIFRDGEVTLARKK